MKYLASLKHSLDFIAMILAVIGFFGVLQTFIVGKHYIIPTLLLCITIFLGNLAYYGYRGSNFAKRILFWITVIFTSHMTFAFFFTKKYREIFGDYFEYLSGFIIIFFIFLLYHYARKNRIFTS